MHRVDARHEFPFRPSNSPKRPGFQTSHPSAWHKQARDTEGRGRAPPPRERASKMRKIHAPFAWKARRGGTRGPGTHPPKKWHKGGTWWWPCNSVGSRRSAPRHSVFIPKLILWRGTGRHTCLEAPFQMGALQWGEVEVEVPYRKLTYTNPNYMWLIELSCS